MKLTCLFKESDEEIRRLERRAQAEPNDSSLRGALNRARSRGGIADSDYAARMQREAAVRRALEQGPCGDLAQLQAKMYADEEYGKSISPDLLLDTIKNMPEVKREYNAAYATYIYRMPCNHSHDEWCSRCNMRKDRSA